MEALFTVPDDAIAIEYGISGPVWLDKNGIVITVNTGEKEHTQEHAESQMAAYDKIYNGVPRPLIVDFTFVKSISKSAREYYSTDENTNKIKALGIVTASSIGQFVGNFVIRVNGTKVPSRIFTDVDAARQWALQYA